MKAQKPSSESQGTLENPEEKKPVKPLSTEMPPEYGGFAAEGLKEPTRYGDWDVRGRCSDF